jgi:hypothetical protein
VAGQLSEADLLVPLETLAAANGAAAASLCRDTKPIAYRLIQRFGSFANAIAAPMNDLLSVQGVGPSGAATPKPSTPQLCAWRNRKSSTSPSCPTGNP